ncbi:MAG: Holliday junction branch migration protein RuvA [Candidatus Nanopelagicales bacterium]
MISHLRGTVSWVGAEAAVIDIGGVGMTVWCAPATLAELRLGHEAQVATSLIVREDSLTLFGFADDDERQVFEKLQSVSGIGPRTAAAILAVLRPDQLRTAVARDDLVTLSKPPGVGRKGAARLALELKDKLGAPASATLSVRPADNSWLGQVIDGLVALGWNQRDASAAAEAVVPQADAAAQAGKPLEVPALLRAALRQLDRA